MAKSKKQTLGDLVTFAYGQAEGRDSDELQSNRTLAMQYYLGEPRGDEIEERSTIVSRDVADTTNAMLAMMRDMLILDAELVIEPEGPQDDVFAKAESDICSDVLLKDNSGERVILSAIKDGLLLKNGVIKVRVDDGEIVVNAVPVENVSYTSGYDGPFQQLPFFSERMLISRSSLIERGLSKEIVMGLSTYAQNMNSTSAARNADKNQVITQSIGNEAEDLIEVYEAYILADMSGSGISKRYRVLTQLNSPALDYEEMDVIPYAMGSPFLASHRLTGESVFDRIRQIQDSNTTMLRQWHDNISVINNGRYVYDPSRVRESDVMAPKAGGGIRASDLNAIVPLMVPDVTMGISAAIQYNNSKRTEAVGAALDMASAEAQLVNKSATAASIEKGNQELVSSMVASNFALTLITGTYRLIHYFLREFSEREYLANMQGEIVSVDPRRWSRRSRMYVRCGMSPSQKANQLQALNGHLQLSAQAMMQGLDGQIASVQTLYRTQLRILRMSGVPDPESIVLDPMSQAAQQAAEQKREAAQQQQAQMAEMQAQLTKMQADLEKAKIAEDARQHDDEIAYKYWADNLKADVEEIKLSAQGVIDLEKQRIANNGKREITESVELDREGVR